MGDGLEHQRAALGPVGACVAGLTHDQRRRSAPAPRVEVRLIQPAAVSLSILSLGHVAGEGDSKCVVLRAGEFQADFTGQGGVGGVFLERETGRDGALVV